MPSKYQPQLFCWHADLQKGSNLLSSPEKNIIYVNDNYCAIRRIKKTWQVFGSIVSFVICLLALLILKHACEFLYEVDLQADVIFQNDIEGRIFFDVLTIFGLVCFLYLVFLPRLYMDIFSRRGCPIIFNRKTQKVYINENYFFNFKLLRNPLYYLLPFKKRIKEYDWQLLQGVMRYESRGRRQSIVLMVYKPNSILAIDHIILDRDRIGKESIDIWFWINNFMSFHDLANLNHGNYKAHQEHNFKYHYIEGQGWPKWMIEAFNAISLQHLSAIKQRYPEN